MGREVKRIPLNWRGAFREKDCGWQMWENTTEGSPISPVCKTPEELAQWLVDNKASAFAFQTATYEEWLHMIRGDGRAVSAVVNLSSRTVVSGVRDLHQAKQKREREGAFRREQRKKKDRGRDGGERER